MSLWDGEIQGSDGGCYLRERIGKGPPEDTKVLEVKKPRAGRGVHGRGESERNLVHLL